MNRKMTDFALAGKCGFLGAIGLRKALLAVVASALLSKKPSAASSPVRPRPVKPAPVSQRNSRRVRPQKEVGVMGVVLGIDSFHINPTKRQCSPLQRPV